MRHSMPEAHVITYDPVKVPLCVVYHGVCVCVCVCACVCVCVCHGVVCVCLHTLIFLDKRGK
jgi:hypothetical protein